MAKNSASDVFVVDVSNTPRWRQHGLHWWVIVYGALGPLLFVDAYLRIGPVVPTAISLLFAGALLFYLQDRRTRGHIPIEVYNTTLWSLRRKLDRATHFEAIRYRRVFWVALNILAIPAFCYTWKYVLVDMGYNSYIPQTWWGAVLAMTVLIFGIIILCLNAIRIFYDRAGAFRWLASVIVFYFCFGFRWLLLVAAVTVPLTVLGGGRIRSQHFTESPAFVLGISAGCVALFFAFGRLSRAAENWRRPTESRARKGDRRPPIVLLRSFQDDYTHIKWGDGFGGEKDDTFYGLEDVIERQMSRYGPFVAVGKPGEVRLTGAARAYYRGDNWQEAVQRWIDESRLCVCIAGWTPGLRWEMETTLARGHAEKLIVIFPAGDIHHEARENWVRHCYDKTPWAEALRGADLTGALAVHSLSEGGAVVIKATAGGGRELDNAIAVAVYGLLMKPDISFATVRN